MLLDESSLKVASFEPVLASMLGSERGEEGCKVLAEAMILGRGQVQLRDWLYCLAKAPGSLIRKRLIDSAGRPPDRFVAAIEGAMDDDEEPKGAIPEKLTMATVSSDTLRFLGEVEKFASDTNMPKVNESLLTLVLVQTLDSIIVDLIGKWAGDDAFKRFLASLKVSSEGAAPAVEIFVTRLAPSDVILPGDFAAAVKTGTNSLAKYLQSRLPAGALNAAEASRHSGAGPVAEELNRLLGDSALFDAASADKTWGGDAAKPLTAKKPDAASLPVINRLILNLWSKGSLAACKLNPTAFDASGRKFCRRLREDCASLGARQITTRHVLYSLLGNEASMLAVALAVRGVAVKTELHAALTREMARPGKKRNDAFDVTRDSVLPSVEQLFKESLKLARDRGAKSIAEFDISRAFVVKQPEELARLFPENKPLDVSSLRAYVETVDPDQDDQQGDNVQRLKISEIELLIKKRVVGQDAAVDRVIPWIKRMRFGLARDGRPAGVFLFLGPTGTGKTQLAKELAKHVYGSEDMMLFMEMGQFQSKESMNMFVGAMPGYVGYGEGKLTNGLRDKPECVVLFDEIEKAFIQVFDTLLRFADEGLISDPAGPVRDGRKCIIVMTTNAGQAWLRDHLKTNPAARNDPDELSAQLFENAMKEMQSKGFRPEFLGRVDERISFLPFTLPTCRKIVDGVLDRELDKFLKHKNITIEVPDDVRDILAAKAYERSSDEGARGAPRAVNEWIVTPAIDTLADIDTESEEGVHLIASAIGLDKVKLETV